MANGKRKTNEVKQEVAPKQSFSIAAASEDMADKGFEQMGANDLALPFFYRGTHIYFKCPGVFGLSI